MGPILATLNSWKVRVLHLMIFSGLSSIKRQKENRLSDLQNKRNYRKHKTNKFDSFLTIYIKILWISENLWKTLGFMICFSHINCLLVLIFTHKLNHHAEYKTVFLKLQNFLFPSSLIFQITNQIVIYSLNSIDFSNFPWKSFINLAV